MKPQNEHHQNQHHHITRDSSRFHIPRLQHLHHEINIPPIQVHIKRRTTETGLFSHLPEEKLLHVDKDVDKDIVGINRSSAQISPRHEGHLLQKIFHQNDDTLEENSWRLKGKKVGVTPKEIAPRVWKPNEDWE